MTDKLIPVSAIAPLVEKWRRTASSCYDRGDESGSDDFNMCADELSEAIAGARVEITDEMRDGVAKAIADEIGHGMREKCYLLAEAAIKSVLGIAKTGGGK